MTKYKKNKILLLIPTLSAGGAERIMAFLASNLSKDLFDCTLVVIGSQKNVAYEVDNTRTIFLDKKRVLNAIPAIIRLVHQKKPDLVMSSIGHLNILLGYISIFFPHITFVGRQAGILKVSDGFSNVRKNYIFDLIRKLGLRKLDMIVCQSEDMLEDCVALFGISVDKLHIINNPITDSFTFTPKASKIANKHLAFVTVGRLEKVKGHERLLKVLSNFDQPFTYLIIGKGSRKDSLVELCEELGLKKQVKFIDYTQSVAEYLKQSDAFLQGSYAEGFPNALLESCAVGTPVLAYDAPGGTKEIVEHDINGFLASTDDEYLEQLVHFSRNPLDPKTVSDSVKRKFSKEIIIKRYEELFSS